MADFRSLAALVAKYAPRFARSGGYHPGRAPVYGAPYPEVRSGRTAHNVMSELGTIYGHEGGRGPVGLEKKPPPPLDDLDVFQRSQNVQTPEELLKRLIQFLTRYERIAPTRPSDPKLRP